MFLDCACLQFFLPFSSLLLEHNFRTLPKRSGHNLLEICKSTAHLKRRKVAFFQASFNGLEDLNGFIPNHRSLYILDSMG
jgi:hypothetical protein